MRLLDQHKALLITALISGTLILAMFSFHIKRSTEFISETFYEVEPQTEEELKALEEELKAAEKLRSQTNEGFNEDEEFKEVMRNFRSMALNDFENTTKSEEEKSEATEESTNQIISNTSSLSSPNDFALNDQERASYNRANDILAMQNKNDDLQHKSNKYSSVTFSLSNREKVYLPPPVYLCEVSGKIVVNITVNSDGQVIDTYINTSSSTTNQCLIDHALEYAQNATFSSDRTKDSQLGSITYYFKSKD